MSFRGRLGLFFLLIVVVPMIAIAFLVLRVAGDSASGKTDAALGQDLEIATNLYDARVADARAAGKDVATDRAFQRAMASGNEPAMRTVLAALARREDLRGYRFQGPPGLASFGTRGAPESLFAPATITLAGSGGGELTVSTTLPDEYLDAVTRVTDEEAAVIAPDGTLVGSLEIDPESVPAPGDASDLERAGDEFRVASAALPGDGGRVALIVPSRDGGFLASAPGVAAVAVAFILLALLAATLVSRTLQSQIAAMLEGARRIGRGDFSGTVPVVGNDEMAGLAREFNEMGDRLAEQVEQLKSQRTEIERSVNRIGEAFASGLDADALLPVLAETAIGACDAEYAMIALTGSVAGEHETAGATEAFRDAALEAEREVMKERATVTGELDGVHTISGPLGSHAASEEVDGIMTVARAGKPFSSEQESVFRYLLGQSAASMENVRLHELVAEQAVTDELTGLPNNRAFRDAIAKEAARAARFRHELALLIFDIDDFKQVNDTYGHPQGDAVLRAIGAILDAESRGIDEPARYGGEEFVVALPETSLEGAVEVAERIRARIEAERVPFVDRPGEMSVTASFGAAEMPATADSVRTLITAADTALYAAKRAGKNRVVAAQGNGMGWRTVAE